MKDRQLLEKAAKAAGFNRTRIAPNGMHQVHCWHEAYESDWEYWNPLTDDGDALRLAVKLNLLPFPEVAHSATLAGNEDPYAATRRAIVRAAAAIGEAL
jgi:hypothetical protein